MRSIKFLTVLLIFSQMSSAGLMAQDAPAPASQNAAPSTSAPAAGIAAAQPIAYDKEPLPSDPTAALLLVSKANGLGGEELKPWYLKAHYQTYDAQGKPIAEGLLELYWAGSKQYKVAYSSQAFTQTFYHLESGDYRSGSSARLPYAESYILPILLSPLTPPTTKVSAQWTSDQHSKTSLACVQIKGSGPATDAYCMTRNQAYLRTERIGDYQAVFNNISVFQHHLVGGDISSFNGARPILKLEVDDLRATTSRVLEALTLTSDATLLSPLEALYSGNLRSSADGRKPHERLGVSPPRLLKSKDPDYPLEVRLRQVQATVKIAMRVGVDGLAHDPVIVSDPDPKMSAAVLESLSKWRFAPAVYKGNAIDYYINVDSTFAPR